MSENWKSVALIILSFFIISGFDFPTFEQISKPFENLFEQITSMTDGQFNEFLTEQSKEIPKQIKVDGKSVHTKTLINELSIIREKALGSEGITSESERAIMTEALVGGAATGLAVGALAGQIQGGSTKATLTGAAIGGLVGTFAGKVIGMNQIREIKNLRLENDKMKDLLEAADAANKKIAEENTRLAEQIKSLKGKSKEERKAIAQQELQIADKKQNEIKQLIADRKVMAEAFYSEQKKEYKKRLKTLKKEDEKLARLIKELENDESLNQPGRIGWAESNSNSEYMS